MSMMGTLAAACDRRFSTPDRSGHLFRHARRHPAPIWRASRLRTLRRTGPGRRPFRRHDVASSPPLRPAGGTSRDCCSGVEGGHAIEPGRSARSVLSPDGDAWLHSDRSSDDPRCVPNLVERLAPSAGYRFDRALAPLHRHGSTRRRGSGRRFGIAQSRESGCRAPHDRFRNPGSTPRTIAMATVRSSAASMLAWRRLLASDASKLIRTGPIRLHA